MANEAGEVAMAGTDARKAVRANADRRRRAGRDPLRKTGWQVRQSVADAVREAVEAGAAESQNALVERALVRELKAVRRKRVYEAYARAAADPVFMQEMRATTSAFEVTAGDGLTRSEG
jgi:hypothetical protein